MATTAITLEEYLKTVPTPDVEYIDGELRERPLVFNNHGLLQSLICTWFNNHEDEWSVRSSVESRTKVSPTRVRLPDVVVDHARKWPQMFTDAPMIVIEILSPGDSFMEMERKALEYSKMGVPNIWLIDPEMKNGRIYEGSTWKEVRRFEVAGREIHLDLDWLFARLERYDAE